MTPDQYRREGAEAMRVKAAKLADWPARNLKAQMGNDFDKGHFEALEAVRTIDVDEVLAGLPTAPDPVARLVKAVKAECRHKSAYDATPPDRGGHKGPKGQAYLLWTDARADVGEALAAMETDND